MRFNLKEQITNKYFWLAVLSLVILTCQQFNLNILPSGIEDYVNSVLTILVALGILNDNETKGLGSNK